MGLVDAQPTVAQHRAQGGQQPGAVAGGDGDLVSVVPLVRPCSCGCLLPPARRRLNPPACRPLPPVTCQPASEAGPRRGGVVQGQQVEGGAESGRALRPSAAGRPQRPPQRRLRHGGREAAVGGAQGGAWRAAAGAGRHKHFHRQQGCRAEGHGAHRHRRAPALTQALQQLHVCRHILRRLHVRAVPRRQARKVALQASRKRGRVRPRYTLLTQRLQHRGAGRLPLSGAAKGNAACGRLRHGRAGPRFGAPGCETQRARSSRRATAATNTARTGQPVCETQTRGGMCALRGPAKASGRLSRLTISATVHGSAATLCHCRAAAVRGRDAGPDGPHITRSASKKDPFPALSLRRGCGCD